MVQHHSLQTFKIILGIFWQIEYMVEEDKMLWCHASELLD